jgi:uncharacterized membrane protein required for colicin V production
MNLLDLLAYVILGLSVAAGYYQGFLATSANIVGYFTAMVSASWFYGGAAASVKEAGKIIPALLYYSESADMLGTVENYRTDVTTLTQSALENILRGVQLPHPVDKWLMGNVLNLSYSTEGLKQLGDYLSRTIAEAAVSIACFMLIFLGVYIGLTIVVNLIHYVVKLPTLKYFDGVGGAALGLVRGGLLVYLAFMILPVVLSMVPISQVQDLVQGSKMAGFFYEKNILLNMIRSFIP